MLRPASPLSLWLPLLLAILIPPNLAGETVRVGILSHRGDEECLRQWTPLATYLKEVIPGHDFVIVPLDFEAIFEAARGGTVEFLLANSAIYTELSVRHGATRIATMWNLGPDGRPCAVFGGTVFFLKSRHPAPQWRDLAETRVAAVDRTSFGGWLTVLREFRQKGGDSDRLLRETRFLGTHDAVIAAVQRGEADAGICRTGTLEDLAARGRLRLADFSVVPCPGLDYCQEFPFLHSTRLYPEWAMAKAAHTPTEWARQVAVALLNLPPAHPSLEAAGYAGWLYPLSYQSVEDCLQELRVRPFENFGRVTFAQFLRQHYPGALAILGLVLLLALASGLLWRRNCQLREARRAAEKAAADKSLFLAQMSHEIRTPMNAVIGITDLLQETDLTAEQGEFIGIIRRGGQTMVDLIGEILDFSKIEAGHLALRQEDFDLPGCVREAVDLIAVTAHRKQIEMTSHLGAEVPRLIRGDRNRLRQVLLNLLGNAAKFTSHGRVSLTVEARPREPGHEIGFTVSDTGPGIEPAALPHLFTDFRQASPEVFGRFGGTGLGLSISQRLCHLMGGEIQVKSEPGRGSTFRFTILAARAQGQPVDLPAAPGILPAIPSQPPDSASGGPAAGPPAASLPASPAWRVLLVDDNQVNQAVTRYMLQKMGLEADTAGDGEEAISRAREKAYDLILMDVEMPRLDGLEATRRILQAHSGRAAPIIIGLSARAFAEERDRALAAGMRDYLVKPVSLAQLRALFATVPLNPRCDPGPV